MLEIRQLTIENIDKINTLRKHLQSLVNKTGFEVDFRETEDLFIMSSSLNGRIFYFQFIFQVNPHKEPQLLEGNLEYEPYDPNILRRKIIKTIDFEKIDIAFENWVDIVGMYNSRSLSVEDSLIIGYQKEYSYENFEGYEFLDENFDFEQQKQLRVFLERVTKKLAEGENFENKSEVIQSLELMNGDLGKMTKSKFILQFSKTMASLRFHAFHIFVDVVEVLKKEMLKRMIVGPLEGFDNWIGAISS
ncbi:hypothetical protein [uncultured Arcticibacterium sp.]|uniref:hypothetical protein n=1 Tax=uncultured Arcticibacterium sp. TaxID=2173042 RepID=UPI0030FBFD0E